MIAVDTNILVYAHRKDSVWHEAAYAAVARLAERPAPWAIPWPCLFEFIAVATHPRIYTPPTPLESALKQIDLWLEAPGVFLLGEVEGCWAELRAILAAGRVAGAQVHDARVGALCQLHGVDELWTADRDFTRFPGLKVRNPLISS